MNKLPLDAQIEAILFFKGEPITKKKLSELLGTSLEDIESGVNSLGEALRDRGLVLLRETESIALGTSALASDIIEKVTKEELLRELGKAGLETLSIILYRKEVAKREIDHIRGVNSSFVIRNLLVRGLVERVEKDGLRGFSYKPTIQLLSFMGLSCIEDLPEYAQVEQEFSEFTKKPEITE